MAEFDKSSVDRNLYNVDEKVLVDIDGSVIPIVALSDKEGKVSGTLANPVVVASAADALSVQTAILRELKIMNVHLSLMTGECVEKADV